MCITLRGNPVGSMEDCETKAEIMMDGRVASKWLCFGTWDLGFWRYAGISAICENQAKR